MNSLDSSTRNEFEPDWRPPPGDTVKDLMVERGITPGVLAALLKMGKEDLKDSLEGKTKLDESLAQKLAEIFKTPAEFWLKREEQYRRPL